jgi:A/G-specific adenine glycosylase
VWGGLWAFPEMDSLDAVDGWCQHKVGFPPTKIVVHEDVSHGFTHFKLNMTPVEIRVEQSAARMSDETLDGDRWLWYNLHRPTQVGLAAPVSRLLHTFGEFK